MTHPGRPSGASGRRARQRRSELAPESVPPGNKLGGGPAKSHTNGRHVARVTDDEKLFYLTDHLGTTVAMTDEAGEVVWTGEATPFGDKVDESGALADSEELKYTGKDRDPETGLYYFNARWYDAELGRFMTEDPARDGGEWYLYANASPLRYVDPSGLSDIAIHQGEWLSDPTGFQNPQMVTVYFEQGSWIKALKGAARWLGLTLGLSMVESSEESPDESQASDEASDDVDAEAQTEASGAASAANVDVTVRPEGVPEDWIETETEDGGRKWTNPNNPYDWVRSSPAKPDSPQPGQRYPNVKRHTPGGYTDGQANHVGKQTQEAHQPYEDFHFIPYQ